MSFLCLYVYEYVLGVYVYVCLGVHGLVCVWRPEQSISISLSLPHLNEPEGCYLGWAGWLASSQSHQSLLPNMAVTDTWWPSPDYM